MTVASVRRVAAAAVAAGLGVVLMSSTGVTLAKWYDNTTLSDTQITTGSLTLEAGSTAPVQLHSRFSVDHRSFTGGIACTAPSGFAACRELSAAELEGQRLLPGDQLLIQETFTAAANGANLTAHVTVDRTDVTAALPNGTTVDTELTRNGEIVDDPAEISGSDPAELKKAEWQVSSTITTPQQWPVSFESRSIDLGTLTVQVEQQAQ
ncbi:hypothetical protein [Brevibacterium luteolum]|uniref:hypothetical protein n=1 Tax=Brevibacterium luteolum TaxID=199591 RepID=UPI00223B4CAE|nr:hypothetical protein [Brevibacterium luteolum]MCT1872267.1 hypothetical protein [Brevibacterium luteolum]MCT1889524.1 hypothetical protein [Brevibacterium luteolum]MCT1892082.1 hypothetical protein [Brevibacterium luteolum]MCT1922847.1 hypothetical protein [Brevibacterium luteolum]